MKRSEKSASSVRHSLNVAAIKSAQKRVFPVNKSPKWITRLFFCTEDRPTHNAKHSSGRAQISTAAKVICYKCAGWTISGYFRAHYTLMDGVCKFQIIVLFWQFKSVGWNVCEIFQRTLCIFDAWYCISINSTFSFFMHTWTVNGSGLFYIAGNSQC